MILQTTFSTIFAYQSCAENLQQCGEESQLRSQRAIGATPDLRRDCNHHLFHLL